MVEHVEKGASLYGYTIQHHHVCLLVKEQVRSDLHFKQRFQSFKSLRKFKDCWMSQKHSKRFIDHRTKGFCSIINFSLDFNRKYSNLDFETKFAQILYEMTEIRQFQNCQVNFNFQNSTDFRGIDFYNACALNNMPP